MRDALAASDAGGTITFATPLFATPQTITLDPTQGQLTLAKSVTITGPGANVLTVARNTAMGTPQFRIFQVNSGVTATISGLTITGRLRAGGADGGGILSDGTLTLTGVAVTNNMAGSNGGGIGQSGGGTLTLTNITLSGNNASRGGGIAALAPALAATNVTASGNTATNFGGGIIIAGGNGTR